MGQPLRSQGRAKIAHDRIELAVAVANHRRIHLIGESLATARGLAGHLSKAGAHLMEPITHNAIAGIAAFYQPFRQLQQLPQQLHRQGGVIGRDRSAERLAMTLQLLQQIIALVVVEQAARAGDAGEPLAQLPHHLPRPLVLRHRQPQQPLTGVVALAKQDKKLRQPGRPQDF